MNGDKVALDTNAVLYLLNGDASFLPFLRNKDIILSFITEIGLLSSSQLNDASVKAIRKFLDKCLIIDVMPAIKEHAIALRKKYKLKLPDAVIASTALTLNIPFITADKKLFLLEEIEVIRIKPNK